LHLLCSLVGLIFSFSSLSSLSTGVLIEADPGNAAALFSHRELRTNSAKFATAICDPSVDSLTFFMGGLAPVGGEVSQMPDQFVSLHLFVCLCVCLLVLPLCNLSFPTYQPERYFS
jgi:hypothetical protein